MSQRCPLDAASCIKLSTAPATNVACTVSLDRLAFSFAKLTAASEESTPTYAWQAGSAEQQQQYKVRNLSLPGICLHQRPYMIALAQETQAPGYHNPGKQRDALGWLLDHSLLAQTHQ